MSKPLLPNNFDFLRLLSAVLVFVSHCYPTYGVEGVFIDPFLMWHGSESLGGIGLSFFFIISGFLVCSSLERIRGNESSVVRQITLYIKKRVFRVFPAVFLFVCLTLGVAGLASEVSFDVYVSHPDVVGYLWNVFIFDPQYTLPYVFDDVPFRGVASLHLWSLPLELAMYVILLTVVLLGRFWWVVVVVLCVGALCVYGDSVQFASEDESRMILGMKITYLAKYGMVFFMGALLYHFREKVRINLWAVLVSIVLIVISFYIERGNVLLTLMLPYLVYCVAFASLGSWIAAVGRYGDFSYGFYLYSFFVQQMVMKYGGEQLGFGVYVMVTFCVSLLCGVVSYHLFEKRFLKRR